MKKENKEKWIAALESGKYKQTTSGAVRDSHGFSAGGVYLDAVVGVDWQEPGHAGKRLHIRPGDGSDEIGIPMSQIDLIVCRNDGLANPVHNPNGEKWTFKQIAQWIRENVEVTDDVQA